MGLFFLALYPVTPPLILEFKLVHEAVDLCDVGSDIGGPVSLRWIESNLKGGCWRGHRSLIKHSFPESCPKDRLDWVQSLA